MTDKINTTIYTACGRCRKPIISPAPHIDRSKIGPNGMFSFCIRCQHFSSCSVWSALLISSARALYAHSLHSHLPVKGLGVNCSICGHGGHWSCYRRLRSERPLVEKICSTPDGREQNESAPRSPPRGRVSSDVTGMPEVEQAAAPVGARELPTDLESRLAEKEKVRLVGHLCAAGCGHWCTLGPQKL